MIGKWIQTLRFSQPDEAAFLAHFADLSRRSRAELWVVLLLTVTAVLIFHRAFLQLPAEVVPLGKTLILGVLIPALLRGLSVRGRPFDHMATEFYVLAALIDIACMLVLRVACKQAGYDVVPLIIPVAILLSLIVVQIRFLLLLPVVLLGLSTIIATELLAFEPTSNELFQLTAAVALVLVALAPAYAIEFWTRSGWKQQRALSRLAAHDELTGLLNRRRFEERFHTTLRAAMRSGRSVTLMLLDVDHFKAYNDHFGHPAGDNCLNAIGNYLRQRMRRPQDFAGRIGGEEFAVVWFDLSADAAERVASELLRGVAELGIYPPPDRGKSVTASGGLVRIQAPPPSSKVENLAAELMQNADQTLYTAKAAGRNRLSIASLDHKYSLVDAGTEAGHSTPPAEATAPQPATALPRSPALTTSARASLEFPAPREAAFRAEFDRQGLTARRLILGGLLAVIAVILVIAIPVLKVPRDQYWIGAATLIFGLAPPSVLALFATYVPRLRRWSAACFIAAVAVILAAQMWERVVQLQKGHDMVPFLMPVSILLSLSVVQIRFQPMATAMLIGLLAIVGIELWVFAWTSHRLLEVTTAAVMVIVTLSFAYKLERSNRQAWDAKRRLDEQAHRDALTGLPNRRKFDLDMRNLIRAALREQRSLAVMMLDIDHFKSYNDHFGHPAGDECIRRIGQHLGRAGRRPLDFAARLGGEEFAVVWFDADDDKVSAMAEQLRAGVGELGIQAAPHIGTKVTASAGLCHTTLRDLPTDANALAEQLLKRADEALYQAKSQGRDQLAVHRQAPPS